MKDIKEMNAIELLNMLKTIQKAVEENIRPVSGDSLSYVIETDEENEYVVGFDNLTSPLPTTVLTTDNINEALIFPTKESTEGILKTYKKFKLKRVSRVTVLITQE